MLAPRAKAAAEVFDAITADCFGSPYFSGARPAFPDFLPAIIAVNGVIDGVIFWLGDIRVISVLDVFLDIALCLSRMGF